MEGILTLLAEGFALVRNDLEEGNKIKGMRNFFKICFIISPNVHPSTLKRYKAQGSKIYDDFLIIFP